MRSKKSIKKYKAPSTKELKAFSIIHLICGILLIVFGLLLTLINPTTGIIAVLGGIFLIVYSKSIKKKVKKAEEQKEVKLDSNKETITKTSTEVEVKPEDTVIKETSKEIKDIHEEVKEYDRLPKYIPEEDLDKAKYLAYSYELEIAHADTSYLTGKGGELISFIQEPENQFDNNAVAIYLKENKVGYMYKNRIQEMVNDWLDRDDLIIGHLNKINTENNTATYKIGFYLSIKKLDCKSFKLTRITKKANEFESSRYDNIECCNDGDEVQYENSYKTNNCIITNAYGEELGELGTKAVDFIEENEDKINYQE